MDACYASRQIHTLLPFNERFRHPAFSPLFEARQDPMHLVLPHTCEYLVADPDHRSKAATTHATYRLKRKPPICRGAAGFDVEEPLKVV